jgi:hypothetical protein
MKTCFLLSCVKKKKSEPQEAQTLYDSDFFKKCLVYSKKYNPDYIFILSAKYGLLELTEIISPYEKTLNNMKSSDIEDWAKMVSEQLKNKDVDINDTKFIFLAGDNYRKYLLQYLHYFEIPMIGLGIGKQLSFLQKFINSESQSLDLF